MKPFSYIYSGFIGFYKWRIQHWIRHVLGDRWSE